MSRRSDIAASAIPDCMTALGIFTTVCRWRDTDAEPFTVDDVTALNIKDGGCRVTHQVSYDEHALEVEFDIVTVAGISASAVEDLLNAVAGAIAANDTWDNLADGTNIEMHDIDTSAGAADTVNAGRLKVTVNYSTEKGQL